ncbi:MAG: 1,4-dihydroxy-2-naphthoate polyprenyltransferase [Beutenbergiaceae bacterium]
MPEPTPPSLQDWLTGARIRTLPAALAPVLAGTGAAAALDGAHLGRAVLAGLVALALQVGVNFANDYSDGIRGTDDARVGPQRLTASGAVPAGTVKAAALVSFAVAGVAGIALCAWSGLWWLLAVGVVCVIAAWYYTGGRSPYGYRGLGEVAVFIFFGLVATLGSTLTQALTVSLAALLASIGIGLLACALLMANNIRDIDTDVDAGKRTLAVRLGDRRARWGYATMTIGGVLATLAATSQAGWWLLVWLLPLAGALALSRRVLIGARGPALIRVLRDTGRLELVTGLAVALLLGLG